jgi:Uma2 family endonuclease
MKCKAVVFVLFLPIVATVGSCYHAGGKGTIMAAATKPRVTASTPRDDIPDVPIYRLSVAQYHAMARAGILQECAPVELLEGWLVPKMTQNPPHVLTAGLIQDALAGLLPAVWHVRAGNPVTTADSEPEPDLAVIRGARRDYRERHPGPQDTELAVEVADTSLRQDRGPKKRLYARAGIAVYWIVNLKARRIAVYTGPDSNAEKPDYRQQRDYGPGEVVPIVLDGTEVGSLAVRELLP